MSNDIKNELKKIYKLTGIKLSVENEDEIDISSLKKLSAAYKEKYSNSNLLFNKAKYQNAALSYIYTCQS